MATLNRGWVRVYRKLQDNPIWTESKFTRGQAWVDLILIANHRPGHIRVRGIKVDVGRGQVAHSEVTLAERWQWSKGKVRRFLSELQRTDMVDLHKSNIINLITIKNYDYHQSDGTANSTTDEPANRTTNGLQTELQTDTNKNDKNVKNEKKTPTVSGDCITFNRSTRKFEGISTDYESYLKGQYPAVDVSARLREMETWLDANPKNQKSNYKRFIANWLKREQDRAPRVASEEVGGRAFDKFRRGNAV